MSDERERNKAMNHIYDQLFVSVRTLLKAFVEDLTKHDFNALNEFPKTPFLHWTRDSGTHLMFMPEAWDEAYPPEGFEVPYLFGLANRYHILNQKVEQAKYWLHREQVLSVHHFDGAHLHTTTPAAAFRLAEDYRRSVLFAWQQKSHRPWVSVDSERERMVAV